MARRDHDSVHPTNRGTAGRGRPRIERAMIGRAAEPTAIVMMTVRPPVPAVTAAMTTSTFSRAIGA